MSRHVVTVLVASPLLGAAPAPNGKEPQGNER
jgi:hypothetical protein